MKVFKVFGAWVVAWLAMNVVGGLLSLFIPWFIAGKCGAIAFLVTGIWLTYKAVTE